MLKRAGSLRMPSSPHGPWAPFICCETCFFAVKNNGSEHEAESTRSVGFWCDAYSGAWRVGWL